MKTRLILLVSTVSFLVVAGLAFLLFAPVHEARQEIDPIMRRQLLGKQLLTGFACFEEPDWKKRELFHSELHRQMKACFEQYRGQFDAGYDEKLESEGEQWGVISSPTGVPDEKNPRPLLISLTPMRDCNGKRCWFLLLDNGVSRVLVER